MINYFQIKIFKFLKIYNLIYINFLFLFLFRNKKMMMNKQTEKRTENKTRFVNKLYNLKDVFEPDYIAWLIKKRFPTITNIKI